MKQEKYGVAITNECPANPRWSRPRRATMIGLFVFKEKCWAVYGGAATQHLRCMQLRNELAFTEASYYAMSQLILRPNLS
jgi:hypothetical protein